ncbi:MAG: ABC transporter permease subunit, partial [Acidimicrobiia bacterium]
MTSPGPGSVLGRLEWLRPRRGFDLFGVLGWTLTVALLWLIMFPLLSTFVRVFTPSGSFDFGAMTKVISDPEFHEASLNTAIVLLVAGSAALLIGSVFAWLNERTDASFGVISRILPLVPLLIPPIALSVGWVFLAQTRAGFLNGFLRAVLDLIGINLTEGPIEIGTWAGMLFVYTIALVPYAYLVVSAALRNMDTSLEEASRMSGANPWVTVAKVSLPAIRPALASAALLLVIVGVSFFSVPRTIGSLARVDTVSVYIVRLTQT